MYTAKDFYNINNVHPYMMLWLFNRREEIIRQMSEDYMSSIEDYHEVDIRKIIMIKKLSLEKIQQETGLSNDDLDMVYRYGAAIHEYENMRNMSDSERQEYIEAEYNFEELDESTLSEEELEGLKEIREQMTNIMKRIVEEHENQQETFYKIIDNNFSEEEDE